MGLTIGISTCLIIFLFVYDELQFGWNLKDKDKVYRILRGREEMASITTAKLLPMLQKDVPGIEDGVRVRKSSEVISYNEIRFNEERVVFTDSNFLDFFKWDLMEGTPSTALKEPNSIVITREIAIKYFGDEQAMGKVLLIGNEGKMVVNGILEKSPDHDPIQLDFLINIEVLRSTGSSVLTSWDNNSSHTYLKLDDHLNPDTLASRIPNLVSKARNLEEVERAKYRLQPYSDIYLKSAEIGYDFYIRGDIGIVRVFLTIAILVLILACFNYMNLSTAQSTKRAKEIGLRKAIGAIKSQLIVQFLVEVFLLSLLSVISSLILVETMLPWFNDLTGKSLSLYNLNLLVLFSVLFAFLVLITLLAGFYPAFVLSRFEPVKVLKGGLMHLEVSKRGGAKIRFRQVMVVLQLASSIALIIGSILIHDQLKYAQNKDLGHDPEQLIVLTNVWTEDMAQIFKNVKTDLEQHPEIVMVSGAYNVPGENINNWSTYEVVGLKNEEVMQAAYIGVEKNFFKILGTKVLMGRDFLDNNIAEENNSCIINEAAAKLFGIENDPIGRNLSGFWDEKDRIIVGVVNNICNKSLHEAVPPVVYQIAEENYPYYYYKMLIKLHPENVSKTVGLIEKVWNTHAQIWPIKMRFISKEFENMYLAEKKVSKILNILTFLAIYISLSGLFGLIAFMAVSRRKEISIRKTLGASVLKIVYEMSKEFILLTIIANVVAWPVIYWVSLKWLERFADNVGINFSRYPIAGFIILLLVILIVGYHSVRSANKNPIDALKYE
ncbi:MAG: ABC transporter permease [Bacteroidetes bacterium]|nr:ABC transporter permease [Bacteroidota bacterium]